MEVLKHLSCIISNSAPFINSKIFFYTYCVLASVIKLGFTVGNNRYAAYSPVGKTDDEEVKISIPSWNAGGQNECLCCISLM